jgi:hypothetical protein
VRYATTTPAPDDTDRFHHVLAEHLRSDGHPRVSAWIDRVGRRPMA